MSYDLSIITLTDSAQQVSDVAFPVTQSSR